MSYLAALEIKCPYCGAEPGTRCVTSTGRTAGLWSTHRPRIDAEKERDTAVASALDRTALYEENATLRKALADALDVLDAVASLVRSAAEISKWAKSPRLVAELLPVQEGIDR